VRPPEDDYPEILEGVIAAALKHGIDAGAHALEPIAYPPREIEKRKAVPRRTMIEVYRRDRWHCRYCGCKTIFPPVSQVVGSLYPGMFPWHRNWKGGLTHPAVISRSPVIDHVEPGSTGGPWQDAENMVCACWICNGIKADFTLDRIGWELRPIPRSDWQGLTEHYEELWKLAGKPDPAYHQSWLAILASTS